MVMIPLPPATCTRYSSRVGPLAEAVFGDGEEGGTDNVFVDDLHADHHVVVLQGHAPHPAGDTPHGAGILFVEADRLAVLGGEKHILLAVGQRHGDQLVPLVQVDGDDPAGPEVGVFHERGLLHHPLAGRHHEVAVVAELLDRQDGGNLLVRRRFNRLTIALPRVARPPSGIS